MKNIICIGPICSGKTTWSLDFVRNNDDYIRFSLDEFRMMTNGSISSDKIDDRFMAIMYNFIININFHKKGLIIDNLPLNIDWFNVVLNGSSKDVQIKLFDVELRESILRNHKRKREGGHFLLPTVISEYMEKYRNFLDSNEFKKFTINKRVEVIIDDFVNINKQFIA
jgi:hypothetical protein